MGFWRNKESVSGCQLCLLSTFAKTMSFAQVSHTSKCLRPFFILTGRALDHARCSHGNIFQPDVYKTNAKLIICSKMQFSNKNTFIFIIFATRSWLPDPGYQILATRSWLPDPGCQILATRSWLPDPVYQILATTSWLPDPGYHILAATLPSSSWLPDPSYSGATQEPSGTIWSYLELSGTIWSYLELPRATYLELSGAI